MMVTGHESRLRQVAMNLLTNALRYTPDGRPVLDRPADPGNVTIATMSSVGFGLSPATGRAVSELVQHGACRCADLRSLRLDRFGNLPADWRARAGWMPPA